MGKDFRGQELPTKAASTLGKKGKAPFRDRVGHKHKRTKESLPGHIYLIAVVGMVGAFLPWLGGRMSRGGKSTLLDPDTNYGIGAFLLFFIAIAAPAMLPLRKATLRIVVIITSLLVAIICIEFLYRRGLSGRGTYVSFGIWIDLIASLALLVSAFLVKREQPEERVAYTGSAETKGLVQDPVLMGDDLDDEGWEDVSESDDDPPKSSESPDL